MGRRAPVIFLGTYLLGLLAFAQRGGPALAERDGYFHARYAQLLPARGLSREFRWTQASTWKDRFCDKELLYHALLVPFTRSEAEPLRGAQAATVLLGLGVFAALFFLLREVRAPHPLLFAASLAAMGGPFLLRLTFVRSHVLSVLLAIAGTGLLLRRRWRAVFILGFFYSWSYSFPLVLLFIALPLALGRRLGGERLEWEGPAAALGGTALGLLVHPYFPNSIESFLTYFDVLRLAFAGRDAAGIGLGREFAPYSTRAFLQAYPLLCLTVAAIPLAGWLRGKKPSAEALAAYLASLCWFAATAVYLRAAEYAAPLAVLAAALAARDFELARREWLAAAALALAGHLWGTAYLARMTAGNDPPRFRMAARWMAENLKEGETVAQLWWDDFPDLYYDGARQSYLIGLDPTYMLRKDPDAALRLEAMRLGRAPLDPRWLAETFDARYLALRADAVGYYPQLAAGDWKPAYADRYAAIFPLR